MLAASILIFIFLVEATTTVTSPKRNHVVHCIESEKQALLSFKQDLVDPLNRLTSWDSNGDDCCKWTGIVCDNTTDHVKQLQLANLYDEGALSGKGEISEALDRMIGCNPKRITSLSLDGNFFSGQLKDDIIEKFENLTSFSAYGNMLSGLIPHSLGKLSALKYLFIGGNQFNGSLPESFGSLSALEQLDIYENLLKGVVSEIHFSNLTNLQVLVAFDNLLTLRMPFSIGSGNYQQVFHT
ncbi:receptor-like protein 53 [Humulus lupulus]|uniref:receptor-like protein 53 n=1 Tax=Humulus lupulus TaxID=3486 RepID=UPI002B40CD7F|nr:receptor-like protein 53 [Humulus lupulus]